MRSRKTIIRTKRVYDRPEKADGIRILVDRLWPRGISRERAKLDEWAREAAPSDELRRWYGHDPRKWSEFRHRYSRELDANPEAVHKLKKFARQGTVTFLYSTKEEQYNNAVALKEYMESPDAQSG